MDTIEKTFESWGRREEVSWEQVDAVVDSHRALVAEVEKLQRIISNQAETARIDTNQISELQADIERLVDEGALTAKENGQLLRKLMGERQRAEKAEAACAEHLSQDALQAEAYQELKEKWREASIERDVANHKAQRLESNKRLRWAEVPCFVDGPPPDWMAGVARQNKCFDEDRQVCFELGWDAALFAVYGVGREGKAARGISAPRRCVNHPNTDAIYVGVANSDYTVCQACAVNTIASVVKIPQPTPTEAVVTHCKHGNSPAMCFECWGQRAPRNKDTTP